MQEPIAIPEAHNASLDLIHFSTQPKYHLGWLALLVGGPLLLLIFKLIPALDYEVYHNALGHIIIVGVATLLASALALQALHIAIRAGDSRVFLIGMGFFAVASIFVIHAVATPNVLMTGRNLATAWSAFLSLVIGSFFFACSGINFSPAANQRLMRHARWLVLLYIVFWLCYGWVMLVWLPTLMHVDTTADAHMAAPVAHDHGESYAAADVSSNGLIMQITALWPFLTVVGVLCYAVAVARHYQFYRRAPSQLGLSLMCGIALLGEALLSQRFAGSFTLSFWLYHLQEFIGFSVISYAVLVAYKGGHSDGNLLEQLFLPGTRAQLRESYDQAMRALLTALEQGTQPTSTLRQTLREQFRLSEAQLEVFEHTALAVTQERRQRQELEKLNATLRQLEGDRDEFTQMLVHDLRSPLTGMIGFLDLLRRGSLDGDQREMVERARQSGRNLAGLIDDLLDIGRMEVGHIELECSSIDVQMLCETCAAEFSAWLQQDAKTIHIVVPDDLPRIEADARMLRRVLFNVVSNAIKHTASRTQITLRAMMEPTTATEPRLIIEIEDTGAGIAAEYLEQIFEKYGRAKNEQNHHHHSTGLGLTFCRFAVEAHGGTIGVTSIVGQGTTFRIIVPLSGTRC